MLYVLLHNLVIDMLWPFAWHILESELKVLSDAFKIFSFFNSSDAARHELLLVKLLYFSNKVFRWY